MAHLLHTLGLPGLLLVFIVLLALVTITLRWMMNRQSIKSRRSQRGLHDVFVKKYPGVDGTFYHALAFNLALILSLATILTLFEYPNYEKQTLVELTSAESEFESMQEIPPTEQVIPPPPKIQQPEIVEVADDEEIEQQIEVDFDMEVTEETVIEELEEVTIDEVEQEEERVDEIFEIVEDPAAPVGGYSAFYAHVSENLHYPRRALDMNVGGKVYVKFVVDKDGSLTLFEVVRGIGFGCDEEAIRVLKESPKWKPGKQRGRTVRQQLIIPIYFKLAEM